MGKYDHLFIRPKFRITTTWLNSIVSALNELHDYLTSGIQDVNVNKVTAKTGEFTESLTLQGKAVLKDGDPIHIASFFDEAKDQITQAIDASKISDILTKQDTAIDRLTSIRDKLSQISVDGDGNLSAKIASPLDSDGNVKVSIPKARFDTWGNLYIVLSSSEIALPVDLQFRYKAGFTIFSGTVTASGNTAEIIAEQFSALEILVKVTSVGGTTPTLSVYIEGKFEATGDWKTLASQENITTTGTWFLTINPLIFRVIRARWVVGGTDPLFVVTIAAQGMA